MEKNYEMKSRLTEYVHGGDIYRNQVEYDFSANINPLGMPERSLEAAKKGIDQAFQYPDALGEELCLAIAEAEQSEKEQIVLGNGAAELIYGLCYALRPKRGLVLTPAFTEYEAAICAAGGETVFWNLEEKNDFCLDSRLLSMIGKDTDILFLCNPNNPTGNLSARTLLYQVAEKCEETGTYLCLDECFLPFLEREEDFTMKGCLKQFPHLVILRAFTKIYGMPGLRLGYALSANLELLHKLRSVLQPWNTSLPAQMAGIEALKDTEYLERTRKLVKREREYLAGELSKNLVEKLYEPAANYIFFKARVDLQKRLLEKGILIRDCSNYKNLDSGFFRIAVRSHGENEELIRRWRKCHYEG